MEYHIALCVKDCLCLFSVAVSISTIIYVPVERNLKGHCSKPTLLLYLPLPLINRRGGGYIGITLSICSSVCVIDCVHSVSPEPLSHFLANLEWWCIIMRQCVVWKSWFTIFNAKVIAPQWGAADAEIKVPSGENTELKCSSFTAWSRSEYSHTCCAYCQIFLPCSFLHFRSIHLHFLQNLSKFFLCWLWLTHGSCVGLQNKIGHPAWCRFPLLSARGI